MRQVIYDIVSIINPCDDLEQAHIRDTLTWIKRGDPLFRTERPAIPPKHLVSYFVMFDESARKILLVDHKKAQLWLPAGGHVEVDENPQKTAARECFEELQVDANFWQEEPLFLTSTVTVGLTPGHTDVSLWYVLRGNHRQKYVFDEEEFKAIQWFGFDEIPYARTDPHMNRFITKLQGFL